MKTLKLAAAIVKDVFAHPRRAATIEVTKNGSIRVENARRLAPTKSGRWGQNQT